MKSLIKWPGGKEREFAQIKHLVPNYTRYIEPFFGGGAVFFNLTTTGKQPLVNDLSPDLIAFYRLIQESNQDFQGHLYGIVECWENIGYWISPIVDDLLDLYIRYRNQEYPLEILTEMVRERLFSPQEKKNFIRFFAEDVTLDYRGLERLFLENLLNKLQRMGDLERKKGGNLPPADIKDNICSGIRSGFYVHFRNIYNDIILGRNGRDKLSVAYRTAVFYFLREYCYGSMFRYNRLGEFNIPYGGISYCKKDFRKKVDYLFSSEVCTKLNSVQFYNLDFEAFLMSLDISPTDFIFLDPPYDSDFSDYEKQSFGQEDQIRLAQYLYKTEGKFILLIKSTPFIEGLYRDRPDIRIYRFDKIYTYNVRGRNQRQTEHLVITNIID